MLTTRHVTFLHAVRAHPVFLLRSNCFTGQCIFRTEPIRRTCGSQMQIKILQTCTRWTLGAGASLRIWFRLSQAVMTNLLGINRLHLVGCTRRAGTLRISSSLCKAHFLVIRMRTTVTGVRACTNSPILGARKYSRVTKLFDTLYVRNYAHPSAGILFKH